MALAALLQTPQYLSCFGTVLQDVQLESNLTAAQPALADQGGQLAAYMAKAGLYEVAQPFLAQLLVEDPVRADATAIEIAVQQAQAVEWRWFLSLCWWERESEQRKWFLRV